MNEQTVFTNIDTTTQEGRKALWTLKNARSAIGMAEAAGKHIKIAQYVIFDRETDTGTTRVIMLKADDGAVYATSSVSFISGVVSYIEAEFDLDEVTVVQATSKNGRKYLLPEF